MVSGQGCLLLDHIRRELHGHRFDPLHFDDHIRTLLRHLSPTKRQVADHSLPGAALDRFDLDRGRGRQSALHIPHRVQTVHLLRQSHTARVQVCGQNNHPVVHRLHHCGQLCHLFDHWCGLVDHVLSNIQVLAQVE